jgi:hypothetical protein
MIVIAILILHALAIMILGGVSRDPIVRSVSWSASALFWIAAGVWRMR